MQAAQYEEGCRTFYNSHDRHTGHHLKLDPYYSNSPILFRLFLQPLHNHLPQKGTQPQTINQSYVNPDAIYDNKSKGNGIFLTTLP